MDQLPDLSSVGVTAEQMFKPHPYEETFTRKDAWRFENVHAKLVRCATSEEHWGRLFHEYGQWQMNSGCVDVAADWFEFAARKQVDAVTAELAGEE